VIEKTRWWGSAIRRHFPSWQLQATDFHDLESLSANDFSRYQLWVIDLNFEDQQATEFLARLYCKQVLAECLLILSEARSQLAGRFLEIGVSRILINPHQENEIIKWIKQNTKIPQTRALPSGE
jgi:hypothetical protein